LPPTTPQPCATLLAPSCPTASPEVYHPPTPTPPGYEEFLTSPNGEFTARAYHEYRLGQDESRWSIFESLELSTADGIVVTSLSYLRPYPGDPHDEIAFAGWSPDSSQLYYYRAWGFDGFITLWDGFDLQSIAAPAGYIHQVVEGLASFRFSPTWRYLVYSRDQDHPRILTVWDLQDDTERRLEISLPSEPYTQVGDFSWAPDESGLVYHSSIDEDFSIYYLPLDTMRPVLLLDCAVDIEWCSFEGWVDASTVQVSDIRQVLEFDVRTGAIVSASTVTPSP
jgi:Tol biopolymer transport system component